jgi:release factor glutamine methyltransferase
VRPAVTSVAELLVKGVQRLTSSPHADRARLDAEALLRHALGKDKAWLLSHGQNPIAAPNAAAYEALLDRRFTGEPIQYITGEMEFYGLPFRVSPAVLIPRPETEHLVEQVLKRAGQFSQPRIVDIGTGSGCIAVALARHLPHAALTAIDLYPDALGLARQNAALNGVANRIRFLEGDLLVPVAGESFDIVVSNPPYVPAGDRSSLSVEVRDHEPAVALFAGPDGLDIYRRLMPAAYAALESGGLLALEIGYGQSAAIEALLTASDFESIEFFPDLQGIPRVVCAQRGPQ